MFFKCRPSPPYTALIIACKEGLENNAAALISGGANIDYETVKGETALVAAVRADKPAVVKLLINRGALVNLEDNIKGITPLKVGMTSS